MPARIIAPISAAPVLERPFVEGLFLDSLGPGV